jgi:membrane-bound lytic murein transglycosylase D
MIRTKLKEVSQNWWIKVLILFFTFQFSLCTSPVIAQVVDNADIVDDEETDDEDDIIDVRAEDEISVTDQDGNEEVIEFPEAMTYDLDSLLNLYMSKTYLGTPGDCEMKNENPTFPKEVYIERLQRIPAVMEMAYNDIVQRFIDRYSGRLRYSVSYMLGALNFYLPIFEEALEAYQVPLELKYLPVIESALNPKAVSRAGAAGLWQFMPATGKQYGLEINSLVDERRDPIKSSYAAARLLRDFYRIFGDWNLAIAAYNCGPENIKKAIHRAGGEKDYWQLYPYLPAETRGYVPAFIAANYIMTYYCEHNICPMNTTLPLQTDTVVVNKNVHLGQIAGALDIDIEQLRALNPEYRRDIVPGLTKPSTIKMTISDIGNFLDHEDSVYNYRTSEFLTHRTVADVNDDIPTFSRSRRSAYNRRSGRHSTRSARNARHGRSSRSSGGSSITVRKGQTLSEIAKRNGTTVAKLRKLNGIKGSNIQAGKKLRIR